MRNKLYRKVDRSRLASLAALWVFALAFGWMEGATVVYLFALGAAKDGRVLAGLEYPLTALPMRLIATEVVREACTLILMGALAWLASSRRAGRIGAFVLVFGLWDLVYYATLRTVTGWPPSLSTIDILFLIPAPWVAPVWAPAIIATGFAAVGTYLYWTADRERTYRRRDVVVILTASVVIVLAFLVDAPRVLDREAPQRFPVWIYWAGVAAGFGAFVVAERRDRRPHNELLMMPTIPARRH